MPESDQAVIARLSSDVAVIGAYLARASADLRRLETSASERAMVAVPPSTPAVPRQPPAGASPAAPSPPAARSDGWIGKALAVAGVAVTLVGVALLLVLAAQAGILRPEVRVSAGAVLAAGLVVVAWRLRGRPGGRVGAIALAATGVAAAYIDVIAVTTVYHWVSATLGLLTAGVVAVGGFLLCRRWDAEALGILVLVPLIVVAPVVADGVTVPLIGFLLALSAASLPVSLGRDWLGLHAARTAVSTLPILVAVAACALDGRRSPALAVGCAIAGVLAVGGALLLLRFTRRSLAMGLLSAAGTLPVLAGSGTVDRIVAALMAGALSAVLLGIVLAGHRLAGVTAPVRGVFSALSATSALVAVAVAFDGPVAGPVLLAMAVAVAVAGRHDRVARWSAVGFGVAGGLVQLGGSSLTTLVRATPTSASMSASTLIASLLMVVLAGTVVRSWPSDWTRACAVVVALYGITLFTVTAGVFLGGPERGFFAGHVAATICWIALAAALLRHAASVPRARRSVPIAGGLALVAASVGKLFSFDLGTLDGIFRVVVFIVVGLALLAMGAGYARLLARQDEVT